VASHDQKSTVLPSRPLSLSSSRLGGGEPLTEARVEATIIVSDAGNNDNAQIVVTQLPKSSNASKAVQQITKTVSPPNVSQSTSGAMTGDKI
jgi:hypothetical protein